MEEASEHLQASTTELIDADEQLALKSSHQNPTRQNYPNRHLVDIFSISF
jgi:hypothetical protein